MRVILGFVLLIIVVAILAFGVRAFFLAYVKKKDERSKWIVTKSMADSFVTLTVMQAILFVIKCINYDAYQIWWDNFKEGLYIEPVLFSFIILGIALMVNTKKHGGSL